MERKNMRQAYGEALLDLGARNGDVVALEADLGRSTMSATFGEKFPKRYFEMGIAEVNMASVAAGFALSGKIPFIHSFAVFATGRCFDQIRQSVCLPLLNVNICGSSAGLSDFGDGATHQTVADIALMRVLPNMAVLVPADPAQCAAMVDAAASWDGPCYLRIARGDLPGLFQQRPYRIGQMDTLREGHDVVVFSCGAMTHVALDAAKALDTAGISVKVVNVGTVKPLNAEAVAEAAGQCRAAVVAEEHSVVGGLGGAILEALTGRRELPVRLVGIRDAFGQSGSSWDELLGAYGLMASDVAKAAVESLQRAK